MDFNNISQLQLIEKFCKGELDYAYYKMSTKVISPYPPRLMIDTITEYSNNLAYINNYIIMVINLRVISQIVDPLSVEGMAFIIHCIAHEIGHTNQIIDFDRYAEDRQYIYEIESNADYQANEYIIRNLPALTAAIQMYTPYPCDASTITSTLCRSYVNGFRNIYGMFSLNNINVDMANVYHYYFMDILNQEQLNILDGALLNPDILNIMVVLSYNILEDVLETNEEGFIYTNSITDIMRNRDTKTAFIKENGTINTLENPSVYDLFMNTTATALNDNNLISTIEYRTQVVMYNKSDSLNILISKDRIHQMDLPNEEKRFGFYQKETN